MNAARRDGWLVAAGVVVMLVALVVVGRLQAGNLAEGDAAGSQPTTSTVRIDATPVASGLAVMGRVALPGPAAAVAVGEDAVWVLLEQGALLRVDPDRHRITGLWVPDIRVTSCDLRILMDQPTDSISS